MLIELTNASFGYGTRAVVRAAALSLSARQCLGIHGANGSGKSTLARGLAGLLPPLAGRAWRVPGLRVGYLPQHRQFDAAWPMSGMDAALLAVSARQRFGWCRRGATDAVRPMLDRLGVSDLAARPFATLSGGQQQRLLLAGALADAPQVLVLDEPTEGLDAHTRRVLLQCLADYAAEGGAVVLVSHDVGEIAELATAAAVVDLADDDGQPSRVDVVTTVELRERMMLVAAPQGGANASQRSGHD